MREVEPSSRVVVGGGHDQAEDDDADCHQEALEKAELGRGHGRRFAHVQRLANAVGPPLLDRILSICHRRDLP
jgi:hypothetical protein